MHTPEAVPGSVRVVRTGYSVLIGIGGYMLAMPLAIAGAMLICPLP